MSGGRSRFTWKLSNLRAKRDTPSDWVLSALDIARRAAMADDLEHVPSIKGIADTFTRMLERLQGIEKNRDDFCVISNEIGSLIESVVRYARENKPVSEKYKVVCDEFLSTISEMEHIFEKRSPKAKAYQTVLSSYQFRFKSLRSDLQALASSTGIFSNSRDITVTGSTFTEIHGNQYIFHTNVTADIQRNQTSGIDDLDFSDYNVLKYSDLRAISVPWKRDRSVLLGDGYERDVPQEYTVRIQNQTMTARTYKGSSALQSFKGDVKVHLEHNFRHPYILQLFGVCSSNKVPTLVFHGDLKDLNQADSIGWDLESRDEWCQLFQMYEDCQAAFCYLMQEHGLRDSPCDFMTQEGQFIDDFYDVYALPTGDISFSNCSCHLYVDDSQHLQVSIEAPRVTRRPGFYTGYSIPKLSLCDVKTIKTALVTRRTIPDHHLVDKKACLLAIYDYIVMVNKCFYSPVIQETPFILISPTRHLRAARLTFNRECRFTWKGWRFSFPIGPNIEKSHTTVENTSWTRFTIHHNASTEGDHISISCHSEFEASPLYLMMWLAQSQRIMSQIKSKCRSSPEHVMALVTLVECDISFSTSLSSQAPDAVYLFIQDLQDVDDLFEIPWFWAKDSEGLDRLSPADMLVFGLGEPRRSKIFFRARNTAVDKDPRIFHEFFGFAPDSPEICHFLDLPVASLEWDGDENGPLTPWELFVWNPSDYVEELDRFMDA
ncbi:hypothetical protein F5887DRAFT_1259629 [Amanita rubescens]|nr:hypothetical protein F5887DRAFT_1259629 [Amanita rubescens]